MSGGSAQCPLRPPKKTFVDVSKISAKGQMFARIPLGLTCCVADRLDVVSIGIMYKRTVIVRVIVRTQPGGPLSLPARRHQPRGRTRQPMPDLSQLPRLLVCSQVAATPLL